MAGERRTVRAVRRVATGADRLWSVISAPGYLEQCHPFCRANTVQQWPGVGSADTIEYYGGRVVHRTFTAWMDGAGYDLTVTAPDGTDQARVRWRIEALDATTSRLTVTLLPLFVDHLSAWIRWAPRIVVRFRMRRYLVAVVAGVAHHAETGERVRRNQFGSHSWFSPAAGS